MKSTLAALVAVGLALWLWSDARRHHEQASRVVRRALRNSDAQLLDDTISLQSVGIARTPSGGLGIRRSYSFEVSFDRISRQRGDLTLLANSIQVLQIPVAPGSDESRWRSL
jgi:hypothetical protein